MKNGDQSCFDINNAAYEKAERNPPLDLTLAELQALYCTSTEHMEEITDKQIARALFDSRLPSCTCSGSIPGTNWHLLARPSPLRKGAVPVVYVCRSSLLE